MSMIIFRNKGTIDPKSITAFGVSSKESASAIGFFGTGLKYAIAIILRAGCRITIHSGGKRYDFGVKRRKVRVDEFDFVTMNGKALDFTTELGKTWEMWMAFRELYCNALDEGGSAWEDDGNDERVAVPDETVITVEGAAFKEAWDARHEVILGTEPIAQTETVRIHPGQSSFVYYRGVRAYRLYAPSIFTYNILRRVDLSEDRSIKYQWDVDTAVRSAWVSDIQAPELIQRAITAPEGSYEHNFSFEGVLPSAPFMSEVEKLARGFDARLNRTAMEACRIWLMDQLHAAAPLELDRIESARLKKAVDFCLSIGYPVTDYPLVVSEFLGEGVLGRAHEGTIYISKRALMMGTKMVAGTILEEFLHLRHKLTDGSLSMQNFLVDAIVTLGEQLTGEPL